MNQADTAITQIFSVAQNLRVAGNWPDSIMKPGFIFVTHRHLKHTAHPLNECLPTTVRQPHGVG